MKIFRNHFLAGAGRPDKHDSHIARGNAPGQAKEIKCGGIASRNILVVVKKPCRNFRCKTPSANRRPQLQNRSVELALQCEGLTRLIKYRDPVRLEPSAMCCKACPVTSQRFRCRLREQEARTLPLIWRHRAQRFEIGNHRLIPTHVEMGDPRLGIGKVVSQAENHTHFQLH